MFFARTHELLQYHFRTVALAFQYDKGGSSRVHSSSDRADVSEQLRQMLRPRSHSSRVKERWTPAASTGRLTPRQGFRSFWAAWRTLVGYEVIHLDRPARRLFLPSAHC